MPRKVHTAAAISLGDRLKQAARNQGLDVNMCASRHVVERVIHHIEPFVPAFYVKGGLLFDQRLRQTADGDISTIRRVSNREMQRAFISVRPSLEAEGITISSLSREPKEISFEYGDPVDRWSFEAVCGTLRANSHLDVGSGNGLDAYPRDIRYGEVRSIMKSGQPFRARMQPLPAAAAEKLLAVVMQSPTDFRVKHLADVTNGDLWDGIDCGQVAYELARICRYRQIPLSLCPEHPEALRWKNLAVREEAWSKDRNAKPTGLTLDQAWIDVNAVWTDVHAELRAEVLRDFRRPSYRPTIVDRFMAVGNSSPAYKPH